ncbi:carcinoembryonic antigen-related cell adhesion molecule 21 isoform X2 [Amia ocellicauda]|uniref:carcinoembryonic antigen-related cell adhesion molecule 21 isoform X2 n=1 Tax=Amia ocellicauda TaxID=2972642 RepID=UPI003463EA15
MQRTTALSALLLALTTGCCALQLVLPPGPVNGTVGGSVRLNTAVNPPTPLLTVTWRNGPSDAAPLVITSAPGGSTYGDGYKGRVSVDRSTGALQITQLTLGDTGTYGVNIITNAGATLTGQVELRVYKLITSVTVLPAGGEMTVVGGNLTLQCQADAPVESRQWSRVGQPLPPHATLSTDNSTLSLTLLSPSDTGDYECRATNPVGTGTGTYSLTVYWEAPATPYGSLSGGVIAGIVIGLVSMALMGGAVCFLLRREGSARSPPNETGEKNSQSAMYENSRALSAALTYENLPAPHTGPGKAAVQSRPEEADTTYTGLQFQDCSTYSTLDRR